MIQDLTLVKDDSFEILVNVINPQEVKTTMSSYTTYTVRGEDKQDPFEVIRRYSDFDTLRIIMLQRWPGCFIPPLPPKKLLNKGDTTFVSERRKYLEIFMQKVAKLKHLWYSVQFQMFIRTPGTQIQKPLKGLPTQNQQQLAKKYDEVMNKLSAKITNFSVYVRKILPIVHNLKEMVANYIDLRSKHRDQFVTSLSYLSPQFQTNCLAEYVNSNTDGKYIFAQKGDEKLTQLITKLKNFVQRAQILQLYQSLDIQQRQIQAFIDVFKQKELYETKLEDFKQKQKDLNIEYSKLMTGKQGFFKSIFKSNIQDNKKEVEIEIEKVKMEKQNIVFVTDISTVILGHFEIDRFKQEKANTYFKSVLKVGECEAEFANIKTQIFEHILQNHNLS